MTQLTIVRTNPFTNATHKTEIVFNQTLTAETIDQLHWLLSTNHPDEFVNFTYGKGFICGQPMNMKLDESKVNAGTMTHEDLMTKWYK